MSLNSPQNIKYAGSHPSNAERSVMLAMTIKEIEGKTVNNEPVIPALRE